MFTGEMIKCTDAIREGLEDIDNEYGADRKSVV